MLLYVYILLKKLVRNAKMIYNGLLKDKDSWIAMQIMIVWFCRVHLQIILQPSNFDSQLHFFAN